jgi:6-phosphogluconolactonase
VLRDEAALARSLAELVLAEAQRCAEARGRFTLALSGGSTPRPAHRLLGRETFSSVFPWDRTHVFWADERLVEPADPASNYGTALEDFLGRVPIPNGNVHPMPAGSSPREAALAYERVLSRVLEPLPGTYPRLDLVLLGLGRDGHTASLFPGDPALEERERSVLPVRGGDPLVDRLTLTLPALNHAERKVFAVSGRNKAETVRAVLEERNARLPASRVEGERTWLLDLQAASRLAPQTDRKTP